MSCGAIALSIASFFLPFVLMFAISRYSGWPVLAGAYPKRGPAPRPLTSMGYGSLRGWIGYNGGLIVGADDAGLHVATWPVFLSWCHAPVFIPWSEIAEAQARRILWSNYYHLSLRSSPDVDFALRDRTFRLVEPWLRKASVPVRDLPS